MATAIGNLFIRIGADTKKLDADLKAAQRRLKSSAKEFKSIGADLSQTVSLPIIAIGAGAVKAFGDLEALQKGLISVMGSAEAAGREFTKLKEVAKLPGLGLEEAVKGSVNLQSAGFSADQAREALLQFGNALATVGKGKNELNLVVLALTQLQNKSSGFGQDLRQLVEQLPQLRGALTNAFGTADSEAIANLGVTGKQVVETLITEFGKLPRVSGGIKNAFENLSDSTKIAFANLGEALNKSLNIEGLLNRISNFVTKAAEAFSRLSPGTQKAIIAIAGLTAAIGPLLFIGGQLAGSFSAIIAAMKTVGLTATVSLGPVGVAVAAIAAAATILYLKWEDIREVMEQVGITSVDLSGALDALTDLFGFLATTLRTVVDLVGNLLGNWVRLAGVITGKLSFREFAESSLEAFKETGTRAAQGFADAFNEEAKKGGTTNRGGAFIRPNQSSSAATTPLSFTPKASGKEVNQFSELPEDVAIKAGLQAGGLTLPFTGELPKLNAFPAAIDSKVLQPLKSVGNELKGIKDSMSQTFKDTFESATDFAARQLQKVVDKLTEANDAIQSGLSQVGSILGPALQVTSQLLDNQSVALDNRQAKEKAQVLATVKNEDEKAKRLAEIDKKYAAEKAKLQRKQAIQNKIAGIFNAIVATFEGVARALALGPAGIPLIPFIKGLGLANVAAIAAAPLPSLAIGTNRVNRSGLAEIHRGEAIVPADVVQGGFAGAGYGQPIEVVGKIAGVDIILGTKNSSELYNRMYA